MPWRLRQIPTHFDGVAPLHEAVPATFSPPDTSHQRNFGDHNPPGTNGDSNVQKSMRDTVLVIGKINEP